LEIYKEQLHEPKELKKGVRGGNFGTDETVGKTIINRV
jgi:hypothetical protein